MEDEKKELSFKQKLATSVLAVFTILIFFVLVINIRDGINSPFQYDGGEDAELCSGGICPVEDSSDKDLLTRDTDKDGVSDWDELNIYKTSPYLDDTDSDGFSDGEEIRQGFDPNCPKGIDCEIDNVLIRDRVIESDTNASEEDMKTLNMLLELNSLSEDEIEGDLGLNENEVDYSDEELKVILDGGSNVSQLRKLLLDAGMDEDILNQIDDETLLATYKELL